MGGWGRSGRVSRWGRGGAGVGGTGVGVYPMVQSRSFTDHPTLVAVTLIVPVGVRELIVYL